MVMVRDGISMGTYSRHTRTLGLYMARARDPLYCYILSIIVLCYVYCRFNDIHEPILLRVYYTYKIKTGVSMYVCMHALGGG